MYSKTKIISLFIAIFLSVASAFAQGGTTGPLTWNFNNGTLTISGNGAMPDYPYSLSVPWLEWMGSINSVIIENGVTSIGANAFFNYENLSSVMIGDNVMSIGEQAFFSCDNLYSIIIPNSVKSIGDRTFQYCENLIVVTFGDNIESIGQTAFFGCKLFSVVIPNKVTIIEDGTFSSCSFLSSVTIPNGVITIGNKAFSSCSRLNSIEIPNSVKTVGDGAFLMCYDLNSITIGESVTNIGSEAFRYCDQVKSITSYAHVPPVLSGSVVFGGLPVNTPVYIPCLSYNGYSNAPGWKNFTNFVIDGPTTEYEYFAKCYLPYSDDNFHLLNVAGIYSTHLENSAGCDSIVTLTLIEKPRPQLCMVSVDENSHNEIVWKQWEKDVPYFIYREDTLVGQYDLVATIESNSSNRWVDMESNAKIRSYRYKVSGMDSCGKESMLSNPHKTMHLTVNSGQGNSCNLLWTAYEGAEYASYNIYRVTGNPSGEFTLIGNIPIGNTSFTDLSAPEGSLYYMIEIMLNEVCDLGKTTSSVKSNIASFNPNSILDLEATKRCVISPNPTTGELRIRNYELGITGIEVFDVYGRKLTSHSSPLINISHLPAGLYFVKITTELGNVVKKVVKQ